MPDSKDDTFTPLTATEHQAIANAETRPHGKVVESLLSGARMTFEFKLTYLLPAEQLDADSVMARLAEAGCTDALVGLGVPGQVGLEFTREAPTVAEAIQSALADVKRALPDAKLLETVL